LLGIEARAFATSAINAFDIGWVMTGMCRRRDCPRY